MAASEKTDNMILALLDSPGKRDQAFRLMVEEYSERLYWHIRHMVLIHDDADDVLQNTWMKVHRNIGKFGGRSGLYTWLYRIATNESINHIKQKKRRLSYGDSYDEVLVREMKADLYFDGDEAELQLQAAIAQLTDKQREVFLLKYYEEKSYKDISDLTGISIGGLKAQYHHATQKIKSIIRSKTFTT